MSIAPLFSMIPFLRQSWLEILVVILFIAVLLLLIAFVRLRLRFRQLIDSMTIHRELAEQKVLPIHRESEIAVELVSEGKEPHYEEVNDSIVTNFELPSKSNETLLSPKEELFIANLFAFIESHLTKESLDVEEVAQGLGVSKSLLHLRVRNLTNTSLMQLIRSIRMKRAQKLLLDGKNISETAFAIGLSDPNYFTKCFKKEFGVTPSFFVQHQGIPE